MMVEQLTSTKLKRSKNYSWKVRTSSFILHEEIHRDQTSFSQSKKSLNVLLFSEESTHILHLTTDVLSSTSAAMCTMSHIDGLMESHFFQWGLTDLSEFSKQNEVVGREKASFKAKILPLLRPKTTIALCILIPSLWTLGITEFYLILDVFCHSTDTILCIW